MTTTILAQLAELDRLQIEALKERWRALFGAEPPGYNRVFLTKRLAYRIQELAYGGLPQSIRADAARLLEDQGFDDLGRPGAKRAPKKPTDALAVGTVFVREWDGEPHRVTVLTSGFEYRGRRYKSLSVIARTITGTVWSGPRFFGVPRPMGKTR
jgi:hypothetical protein